MKRVIAIFALLVTLIMLIIPVFAVPSRRNISNQNLSKHLYLFEKNNAYLFVEDGAWGKLNIDKCIFNAHHLEKCVSYTLTIYSGCYNVYLGEGVTDNEGNIHIIYSYEALSEVPVVLRKPDGSVAIWLVLTEDLACSGYVRTFIRWRPVEYLFEFNCVLLPV